MNAASDLARRWRRARCSALRTVLSEAPTPDTEEELLPPALSADAPRVLKSVFDNSLELGKGFRVYYRVDIPLTDLVTLLPQLETPCTNSRWTPQREPAHFRSERSGCDLGSLHDRACDYFREAIDGLVLGLTGTVYHTRYESRGHGSQRCVDALYVHPLSPARYGPIPEFMHEGLEQVRRTLRLFDSSCELTFLGVSESTLYYRVEAKHRPGNLHLTTVIQQALERRYPDLISREASPRAVLGESA